MANESVTVTQTLDQVTVVSEGPVGLNAGGTILGALNVGVDGTGHDVKFFGDGTGKYMQWDADTDKLFINGELEVNGSATTFNSTVITIDDPIFSLGGQQRTDALDDSKDRGLEFFYHDGAQKTGFMGYDDSADAFTFLTSATNSNEVFSGTAGKLIGQDFLAGSNGKFGWSGDTNTYMYNLGDRILFSVGGLGFADFSEGAQDIVHFNYNENQDIDFKVGYNGGTSIFSEGSSGDVTFGGTIKASGNAELQAGSGRSFSIANGSDGSLALNGPTLQYAYPSGDAQIFIDSSTGNSSIRLRNNGGTRWVFGNEGSTDDFVFTEDGSNERLRIQEGGNVGIGTTAPSQLLDVKGKFTVNENGGVVINDGTIPTGGSGFKYLTFDTAWGDNSFVSWGNLVSLEGVTGFHTTGNIVADNLKALAIGGFNGVNRIELYSPSSSILEQRLGTNPQEFRIYGTYTDSSNYERGSLAMDASGNLAVQVSAAGTGTAGNLLLQPTAGNVGIGTTAPSALLEVVNTGATSVKNLRVKAVNGQTGNLIEAVDGGNNPIFEVGREAADGQQGIEISGTLPITGTRVGSSTAGLVLDFSNKSIQSYASTALTINSAGNNVILVPNSGSVGIGTTAPSGKLTSYVSATRQINLHSGSIGADFSVICDNSGNPAVSIKGTGTADLLNVFDDTTEVFTILDGGNVGIGVTAPATKLDVADKIRVAENSNVAFYGADFVRLFVNQSYSFINSGGTVKAKIGLAGDSYFNGGNVGIGTTAPAGELEIQGTGDLLYLRETGREAATITGQGNGSGSQMIFKTHSGSALSEAMRILPSGNVGIGTTSPTENLEVVGDVLADRYLVEDGASSLFRDGSVFRIHGTGGTDLTTWLGGYHAALSVRKSATAGLIGINNTNPIYALDVTGGIRFSSSSVANGDLTFNDNKKANFGNSTDLRIYHDGTNSHIYNASSGGDLRLTSGGNESIRLESSGLVRVFGDLQVDGTTTTVNSTVVTIDDPVLTLGGDTAPSSDDNKDRGIEFRYYDGSAKIGFMGWDDSAGGFTLLKAATNSSEVFSGTAASLTTGAISAGGIVTSGDVAVGGHLNVNTGSIDMRGNDLLGLSSLKIEMDGAAGFKLTNPNNAHGVDIYADDLTFYGGGIGTRRILTDAGDLEISPVGNVGIGVAAPSTKVHILNGTANDPHIRLSDPNSSSTNDATGFLEVYHGNTTGRAGYFGMITNAEMAMATTTSSGNLCLYTGNGVRALCIDNSQQVGIGTDSPAAKLHIEGTDNEFVQIIRTANNNAATLSEFNSYYSLSIKNRTSGSFLNFGGISSYTDIQATDGAGSPTAKHILLNPFGGNVGIGNFAGANISDLSAKLHVRTSDAGSFTYDTNADDFIVESNSNGGMTIATASGNVGRLIFASPDDPTGAEIRFSQTGNLMKVGPTTPNADLVLQAGNSTELMRLDASSGNIGVFTSTPSFDFDIHGHVRITDNKILRFGEGDIQIYHNSTTSNANIENYTGSIFVTNYANDSDIVLRSDDGSGGVTPYLTIDGSNETVAFSKAITQGTTLVNDANHTTTRNDTVILFHSMSTYRNLTIASADCIAGRMIHVKNRDNNQYVYIYTEGSETIDGASSDRIDTTRGAMTLVSDGSNWSIISKYTT